MVGPIDLKPANLARVEVASSLDHLIGTGEQNRWKAGAKNLRGLRVDGKFEAGRLLNGRIGWVGTLQDFVHKSG